MPKAAKTRGLGKLNCVFPGCKSREGQGVSFFLFPRDPERSKIWVEVCNRDDLCTKSVEELGGKYKMCEMHFEDKYISKGGTKKTLFSNAVPTFRTNISTSFVTQGVPERQASSLIPNTILEIIDYSKQGVGTLASMYSPSSAMVPIENHGQVANVSSDLDIEMGTLPGTLAHLPNPSAMVLNESHEQVGFTAAERSSQTQVPQLSGEIQQELLALPSTSAQPPLMSPTATTQTSKSLSSGTPRKQKLLQKIRRLRKLECRKTLLTPKSWDVEDFFKLCDIHLSEPLSKIVKEQALLKNKKPVARRYSAEYKQFALTLHFLGPRAYSFMKFFLYLPSERSLRLLTQKFIIKPGLGNEQMFKALQIKVGSMFTLDKHCALCIDEMSIKAHLFYNTGRDEIIGFHDTGLNKTNIIAQNVCVIMARGLYQNWKQPIGFFFVNTQLKASELIVILRECIKKLTNIGLYVHALITDMGSNFVQLANLLKVTPEKPEFEIGPFKLLYFFDTCHLIKATKNNLVEHTFCFNEKKNLLDLC